VIENRLKVYNAQTAPLIEHYQGRNLLKIVNADQPMDKVYAEFVKVTGA
jgi:adenylate kinase